MSFFFFFARSSRREGKKINWKHFHGLKLKKSWEWDGHGFLYGL